MPAITFKGDVRDANGATTILSVHAAGYNFSKTFKGTFSITKNLPVGDCLVLVICCTDGEMKFDILGNLTTVSPDIPYTFDIDHDGNPFQFKV